MSFFDHYCGALMSETWDGKPVGPSKPVSDERLVRSWIAFQAMYERGEVVLNIGHDENAALLRRGWDRYSNFPWITNARICDLMKSDPFCFYTGYFAGIDVMGNSGGSLGGCIPANALTDLALDKLDLHEIERIFSPHAISKGVSLLQEALRIEMERENAIEQSKTLYKTSPSILADPWGFITAIYRITSTEVRAERTFLGMHYEMQKVQVQEVTRARFRGAIVGDVVFAEGSAEPVVWKNVFLPKRKYDAAWSIIRKIQADA
ncbi:MAG: hypothetical protein V3U75_04750 [Methylococcaceae bacterium]